MSSEQACVLTGLELHKNKGLLLQIADHQVCPKYSLYLKFKFVDVGSLYACRHGANQTRKMLSLL